LSREDDIFCGANADEGPNRSKLVRGKSMFPDRANQDGPLESGRNSLNISSCSRGRPRIVDSRTDRFHTQIVALPRANDIADPLAVGVSVAVDEREDVAARGARPALRATGATARVGRRIVRTWGSARMAASHVSSFPESTTSTSNRCSVTVPARAARQRSIVRVELYVARSRIRAGACHRPRDDHGGRLRWRQFRAGA